MTTMRALLYASWLQHWTVQQPMDLLGSFSGTVALVAEALTHGSRCGHCRAPTGVLQLLRERVISKLRVAEEGWWGNLHQGQSTQQMHLHVSGRGVACIAWYVALSCQRGATLRCASVVAQNVCSE